MKSYFTARADTVALMKGVEDADLKKKLADHDGEALEQMEKSKTTLKLDTVKMYHALK